MGSMTTAPGAVTPELIVCSNAPAELNSVTLFPVEFATHTLPEASNASDVGAVPTVKGELPKTPPALVKVETWVLPVSATHALPLLSMAIAVGVLSPLLLNGEPLTDAPFCASTVTVLLPEFAIHTCPLASTVVLFGALKPPYTMESVRSLAELNVVANGAGLGILPKICEALFVGYFAKLSAAPNVSVGAVPPLGGVV